MPFIGNAPATHFETTPAVQRFSGNGSTKTFTLNRTVASKQSILVSVDGVVQDAASSYTVPDGTTLTFRLVSTFLWYKQYLCKLS